MYRMNLAGGAEQTEIANYFPVVCPSGRPAVVQNRSRRFCVRRVEKLFAFADKVEDQVNEAQIRVNNLTQSILAKAFRGELTADYKLRPCGPTFARSNVFQAHLWRTANPSLISGSNSAEALLERIKAERAAASNKPSRKTRI